MVAIKLCFSKTWIISTTRVFLIPLTSLQNHVGGNEKNSSMSQAIPLNGTTLETVKQFKDLGECLV